jgi:hypothetical protein
MEINSLDSISTNENLISSQMDAKIIYYSIAYF